jgi:hypothetical protein
VHEKREGKRLCDSSAPSCRANSAILVIQITKGNRFARYHLYSVKYVQMMKTTYSEKSRRTGSPLGTRATVSRRGITQSLQNLAPS